jgi:hypothetical protein
LFQSINQLLIEDQAISDEAAAPESCLKRLSVWLLWGVGLVRPLANDRYGRTRTDAERIGNLNLKGEKYRLIHS